MYFRTKKPRVTSDALSSLAIRKLLRTPPATSRPEADSPERNKGEKKSKKHKPPLEQRHSFTATSHRSKSSDECSTSRRFLVFGWVKARCAAQKKSRPSTVCEGGRESARVAGCLEMEDDGVHLSTSSLMEVPMRGSGSSAFSPRMSPRRMSMQESEVRAGSRR